MAHAQAIGNETSRIRLGSGSPVTFAAPESRHPVAQAARERRRWARAGAGWYDAERLCDPLSRRAPGSRCSRSSSRSSPGCGPRRRASGTRSPAGTATSSTHPPCRNRPKPAAASSSGLGHERTPGSQRFADEFNIPFARVVLPRDATTSARAARSDVIPRPCGSRSPRSCASSDEAGSAAAPGERAQPDDKRTQRGTPAEVVERIAVREGRRRTACTSVPHARRAEHMGHRGRSHAGLQNDGPRFEAAGLQHTSIADLQSLWQRIEELGFDWISIWDHFCAADNTGDPHCLGRSPRTPRCGGGEPGDGGSLVTRPDTAIRRCSPARWRRSTRSRRARWCRPRRQVARERVQGVRDALRPGR